jgi:hypothetical protein
VERLVVTRDSEAGTRAAGAASVEARVPEVCLPDVLTLAAVPLAVSLTGSAVCAVAGRLVAGLRGADRGEPFAGLAGAGAVVAGCGGCGGDGGCRGDGGASGGAGAGA